MNKIDRFQVEDVFEAPETTDSEKGLVDNLDEVDVEQDEQEEESQDTQEKRVLNVTMPYLHTKAKKKKKNSSHCQLLIHS